MLDGARLNNVPTEPRRCPLEEESVRRLLIARLLFVEEDGSSKSSVLDKESSDSEWGRRVLADMRGVSSASGVVVVDAIFG